MVYFTSKQSTVYFRAKHRPPDNKSKSDSQSTTRMPSFEDRVYSCMNDTENYDLRGWLVTEQKVTNHPFLLHTLQARTRTPPPPPHTHTHTRLTLTHARAHARTLCGSLVFASDSRETSETVKCIVGDDRAASDKPLQHGTGPQCLPVSPLRDDSTSSTGATYPPTTQRTASIKGRHDIDLHAATSRHVTLRHCGALLTTE